MTDVPTEEDGLLALAVSLDGCSRRVVGWSMQEHLRTELVLAALQRAIWNRHPREGLIHHADHGCPYTSLLFGERCQAAGIQCSMGSIGDGYDNAMVDRFLATLACELLAQQPFRTHDDARAAVFEWLEIYSHRQRRHSALGFLSPDAYERGWSNHTPVVA